MIRPDNEWHAGSLEPVSPLTKSQTDRQKFTVTDVVIALRRRKAMGVKGATDVPCCQGTNVAIRWHPPPTSESINLNYKLSLGIRSDEDGSGG